MKTLIVPFLMSSLMTSMVLAQDKACSQGSETWDKSRCATTGAGLAVGVAAGIYAMKKYSAANSIEKEYTVRVFSETQFSASDANAIARTTQTFTNGDRITIAHQLSESANRQYHIHLMEERAANARSSAAFHGAQALTATRQVAEQTQNLDGTTSTTYHTEPDYTARAMHAQIATSALAEASNYQRQADLARRGEPVPMYTFEEVIKEKTGTAGLATDFIKQKLTAGGKILTIDRLPVEKFALVRSAVNKGRAGVAGVVLGAGLAAEEAIDGAVARKIQGRSQYSPAVQAYDGAR
jgi:hypothetical protein